MRDYLSSELKSKIEDYIENIMNAEYPKGIPSTFKIGNYVVYAHWLSYSNYSFHWIYLPEVQSISDTELSQIEDGSISYG